MSLISYVTKIHFAENVLEDALEVELEALRLIRPLVVSDHGGDRQRVLDRLLAALPGGNEPILFHCPSGRADVAGCAAAGRLHAEAGADGVVAFGGPAAINLAKALAVRVSHPGPLAAYDGLGGSGRIRAPLPPVLAIPTTADACSEIVNVATIAGSDGAPLTLVGPALLPRVVICDPTLTLDLSPERTASAGMDTLTHCIETYIATAYNPPADGIARDGMRRAIAHLERVVADGADLPARREMMAAALNGALAQQKGLGAVHAMSHALAAVAGLVDHGALNAVLLPQVLAFNAPAVPERYAGIRHELGLAPGADLPEAMVRLRERVALPAALCALGIGAADLAATAAHAATGYSSRTNPRRAGVADYLGMLRAVL